MIARRFVFIHRAVAFSLIAIGTSGSMLADAADKHGTDACGGRAARDEWRRIRMSEWSAVGTKQKSHVELYPHTLREACRERVAAE
jgi:hypothetical protein